VCWPHGLAYRSSEIVAKGIEVDHIAQPIGESVERPRGVVPRPIEAPVDRILDPSPDRLEKREANERRRGDCRFRPRSHRAQ
jgi:hypothetical protein